MHKNVQKRHKSVQKMHKKCQNAQKMPKCTKYAKMYNVCSNARNITLIWYLHFYYFINFGRMRRPTKVYFRISCNELGDVTKTCWARCQHNRCMEVLISFNLSLDIILYILNMMWFEWFNLFMFYREKIACMMMQQWRVVCAKQNCSARYCFDVFTLFYKCSETLLVAPV